MDYKQLLENANKELSSLESRKAVLSEKIDSLVSSLGLDSNKPLAPQIEELDKSLKDKKSSLEAELQEIVNKLNSLSLDE